MRNIEKMATLAIVLLILSIPTTYATKSSATSKVSVSAGDARANSEAISSDGGITSAISDITASEGNSVTATSKADASGIGDIASATTITINQNGDCRAQAVGGNIYNCITTGIGNVAVTGGPTTGIGNVAVTENVEQTTTTIEPATTAEPISILLGKIPVTISDTPSGDISIATSEDGSSGPIVIPGNVITIDGYNDASIVD